MTDYTIAFWNVENLFDIENSPRCSEKLQRTIGNHWPSRSAGQYESEPYRIIAGETLANS